MRPAVCLAPERKLCSNPGLPHFLGNYVTRTCALPGLAIADADSMETDKCRAPFGSAPAVTTSRRWRGTMSVSSAGDGEMAPAARGALCSACLPPTRPSTPLSLDRLAHEYALREELDGAWAARPHRTCARTGSNPAGARRPGRPTAGLDSSALRWRSDASCASRLRSPRRSGMSTRPAWSTRTSSLPTSSSIPPADAVWLTGFGIASRLPRERQPPRPPEVIAGHARLYGARADRSNEPLRRFAQRPLCARRDILLDADRESSVCGF